MSVEKMPWPSGPRGLILSDKSARAGARRRGGVPSSVLEAIELGHLEASFPLGRILPLDCRLQLPFAKQLNLWQPLTRPCA